jgi:hypothetical protein
MRAKEVIAGLPKINAFISYSQEDRGHAGQVKGVLADFGIGAFLAHEDIEVSHDWRERILQELRVCDLFVPLLSRNFLLSKWAHQETGFIVSRPEPAIVPLSIDETIPFGFISHVQSRRIPPAGVTTDFLLHPLARYFPRTILPNLIRSVADAGSFSSADARLKRLVPFFSQLTTAETQALADEAVKNAQIWDAQLCRDEYLPELIRLRGPDMDVKTRRALQYQLRHHTRYRPEEDE